MGVKKVKKHLIYILAGGLKQEGTNWRTTTYTDPGDNFGITGDRLRVDAAYALYKKTPNVILIASGGKGQYKNIAEAPTVASVLVKEIKELGVPDSVIVTEEISNNTAQQLEQLDKLLPNYNWEQVTVLTNEWHLPRVKTMLEKNQNLAALLKQDRLSLKDAEAVLLDYDRAKWHPLIKVAYASEGFKKRLQKEVEGIKALQEGKYNLGHEKT